jgi:D-arabinose 1-dehydrogenase-like Zn-dependent alcohol dehydrogenase
MKQFLDAVKMDGVISIIGFLGQGEQSGMLEPLMHSCIIRGILVGPRLQFEEMNRAIDANKIRPVVDDKIFGFEDAKSAYQYTWDRKISGKLSSKREHNLPYKGRAR